MKKLNRDYFNLDGNSKAATKNLLMRTGKIKDDYTNHAQSHFGYHIDFAEGNK